MEQFRINPLTLLTLLTLLTKSMSKRTKVILTLIITIVLVFLALVIYLNYEDLLGLLRKEQPAPVTSGEETGRLPESPTFTNITPVAPGVSPEQAKRGQLAQFVSSFVEKFGSFSNQNNYQNLQELQSSMTPRMWSWVEDNLITGGESASGVYSGQTTKALSTKEVNYNEATGEAEFLVKCQRQETGDNLSIPRVYYQDIFIKLEMSGEEWLVEGAYWK